MADSLALVSGTDELALVGGTDALELQPGGSTTPADDETGAGVDAGALLVLVSASDTGSGADSGVAVFDLRGRDRAEGTEAEALAATSGQLIRPAFIPQEAVAYGPASMGQASDAPAVMTGVATAAVYRLPGMTLVTVLPLLVDGEVQDQKNEPGFGSMLLQYDDPAVALIQMHDVVRVSVDGVAAKSWLVEQAVTVLADPVGAARHTVTYQGRGLAALWERFVVFPARGPDVIPVDEDRWFNWTSPVYDDSAWPTATVLHAFDPASGFLWGTPLSGWPDPTALYLWDAHYDPVANTAPAGYVYFRTEFTAPHDGLYTFFLHVDDAGRAYVDGTLILESENNGLKGTPTALAPAAVTIFLTAGAHTYAVEALNTYPGEDDDAKLLAACYDMAGPDELGTLIFHSDGSWLALGYPPGPPGMTDTQIVRILLEEAQARGVIPFVTLAGCTDATYSDGSPSTMTDYATKVGTDGLTVLRELAAVYIDFWEHPADTGLELFRTGTRGRDAATTSITLQSPTDPADTESGNITRLQFTENA